MGKESLEQRAPWLRMGTIWERCVPTILLDARIMVMKKEYQYAFYLICAVQLIFAVGFSWQLPLAVNVWSLPDITPLPYLIVVTYRGLLAIYYLFAEISTHVWSQKGA
jgi:hypothetical protein